MTGVQQNILMDASGNARLVDFGLAVITENPDSGPSDTTQHGHTPRWAAPEVLDKGVSSKKADIFSFAMVMIEVRHGQAIVQCFDLVSYQCRYSPAIIHSITKHPIWLHRT